MAGSIASSIISLLVIFGLLIIVTILLHRFRNTAWGKRAGASPITLVASRPLGGQHSLIIAEVAGERFLIGISRNSMTAIARLDDNA